MKNGEKKVDNFYWRWILDDVGELKAHRFYLKWVGGTYCPTAPLLRISHCGKGRLPALVQFLARRWVLKVGFNHSCRCILNNVTFGFGNETSRDLTVDLQNISYDRPDSSQLLISTIPVLFNSVITHLWLPVEVRQQFEKAFDITWNETAQLYLLDTDTHAYLSKLNATFTFPLGHAGSGRDVVEIALPYSAFNLEGSPPFIDHPSKYFPPMRAERPEQYMLGRMFLQGAYVVADYERQNFSVSQALFPDASQKSGNTIVEIAPLGSADTGLENATSLSAGDIAGIVMGAVIAISIIAAGMWWCARWRKTKAIVVSQGKPDGPLVGDHKPGMELDGLDSKRHELSYLKGNLELDGVHIVLTELDPQTERQVELARSDAVSIARDSAQRHELP